MSREELINLLNELQGRLLSLNALKSAGGQLDNPKEIREIRRNIARINYIMKNKNSIIFKYEKLFSF